MCRIGGEEDGIHNDVFFWGDEEGLDGWAARWFPIQKATKNSKCHLEGAVNCYWATVLMFSNIKKKK